jgi:hypothetical protein
MNKPSDLVTVWRGEYSLAHIYKQGLKSNGIHGVIIHDSSDIPSPSYAELQVLQSDAKDAAKIIHRLGKPRTHRTKPNRYAKIAVILGGCILLAIGVLIIVVGRTLPGAIIMFVFGAFVLLAVVRDIQQHK